MAFLSKRQKHREFKAIIETEPTRLERAYSAGQTTQVPAGRVVAVRKRVRRKIGYNGVTLSFERARSAPR
jgi:hypothetical protein